MKRQYFVGALKLLLAAPAFGTTISFLNPTPQGVDGDTSAWTTDDNVVDTGKQSYSLLGGQGTVSAYQDGATTYYLDGSTHNVTLSETGERGLGVWDDPTSSIPVEGDEIDNFGGDGDPTIGHETIQIDFANAYDINSVEVRSLFDSTADHPNTNYLGAPTPPEEAQIDFYLHGTFLSTTTLIGKDYLGLGDGEQDITFSTPIVADKIVFRVPTSADLGLTVPPGDIDPYIFTDYSVAQLDVTAVTVPLPRADIAALPLAAVWLLSAALKRRGRRASAAT